MLKWLFIAVVGFSAMSGARAQEREWTLDATDEDVFLVFGVTGTDDVGVSFWCKRETKSVSVFSPLPKTTKAPAPNQLTLGIGGSSFQLTTEPAGEIEPTSAEAKLVPQQPILDKLLGAEVFSLDVAGHKATIPLVGADLAGLLKLCNTEPSEAQ
jgi:hypothetical protein